MLIHLHKQAPTTPKIHAAIQASMETAPVLAERFGVAPQTVCKWRKRDSVKDRSHTPHRLQTTLTPAQEAVAVALRRTRLCCTNRLRDSPYESRMISGGHEQLGLYEVQDHELAFAQHRAEAARVAFDLV